MAIKKESLSKLLVRLKLAEDETKANALIEAAEEKELAIPDDTSILSKGELESRDRQKYNEGKTAGEEMTVKQMIDDEGLTINGKKDVSAFKKEFEKKILANANISVDEKVKERDKTIDGLRNNIKEKDNSILALQNEVKGAKTDSQWLGMLHPKRAEILSDNQYLTVLKSEFELTEVEGKPAIKNIATGEIVKDKNTLLPLAPNEVIKSHFEAKAGWIKAEQQQQQQQQGPKGRNGEDSRGTPSGITNMKQFKSHLTEKGIDIKGQQAQQMLKDITTANPQFDMSEN